MIHPFTAPAPDSPADRLSSAFSSSGAAWSSATHSWPWEVQHFGMDERTTPHWQEITRATLWVHLPRAETTSMEEEEEEEEEKKEEEEEHAWINLYYVSVDKNGHVFLSQEAATKVM